MNIHSEKNFNGESYQSSDGNEENKFESTEEFSNAISCFPFCSYNIDYSNRPMVHFSTKVTLNCVFI